VVLQPFNKYTMYHITDKLYTPIFVHKSFIKYKVLKKIWNFSKVMSLEGSKPWCTDYIAGETT